MSWQSTLKKEQEDLTYNIRLKERQQEEELQRELTRIGQWADNYPSGMFVGPSYIFIKIDEQRGGKNVITPKPDPMSGVYYIGKYTLELTGLTKQEMSQKVVQYIKSKGYETFERVTDEEIPITRKDLTRETTYRTKQRNMRYY